jgi:hypothetical protein
MVFSPVQHARLTFVLILRILRAASLTIGVFVVIANNVVMGDQYGITRNIPSLQNILAASAFLTNGDIPVDNFLPPPTTVYVATIGSDTNSGLDPSAPLATIEAAIQLANDNPSIPGTILIHGGTYYYKATGQSFLNGQDVMRGNLYISSFPGETVIIRPVSWTNSDGSADWNKGWEASALVIDEPVTNLVFDGLTFEGWQILFNFNYSSTPSSNIVFKNIEGSDFRHRSYALTNSAGVVTNQLPDPTQFRSFIQTGYNPGPGQFATPDYFTNPDAYLYQIYSLIISNVSVDGGVEIGINIGDEHNPNVRGLRICNFNLNNPPAVNSQGNSGLDGIGIVNSYKVLVDDTTVENAVADGIDTKSRDISVVNCLVTTPWFQGVKFWQMGEMINTIVDNALTTNGDAILLMGPLDTGEVRLINCDIVQKGTSGFAGNTGDYDGLYAPSEESVQFVNDIFANLPRGYFIETTNLVSSNCCYFDVTNFLISSIDSNGITLGLPTIATTTQMNLLTNCSGNTSANPAFVDPVFVTNFSVLAGSPCIGGGTANGGTYNGKSVSLPTFDFYGNPRNLNAPDIGAITIPLVTLTITSSGTNVVISWSGNGTLQSSTNVIGIYTDVSNISNPYTMAPIGNEMYFRVRQ